MSKYAEVAANKTECRSCIMPGEQDRLASFKSLDLKEAGVNKEGALIVDMPPENSDQFVAIYLELMPPGYWSEYVGPKSGFFFKLPNGEKRHIELTEENQPAINETMQIFIPSWDSDQDLWEWLSGIDIYRDWLQAAS